MSLAYWTSKDINNIETHLHRIWVALSKGIRDVVLLLLLQSANKTLVFLRSSWGFWGLSTIAWMSFTNTKVNSKYTHLGSINFEAEAYHHWTTSISMKTIRCYRSLSLGLDPLVSFSLYFSPNSVCHLEPYSMFGCPECLASENEIWVLAFIPLCYVKIKDCVFIFIFYWDSQNFE